MEYLGFYVGYGWWKPAASKMQPLQDMQIRDDPKKGLHDVRSFVGACNFYRRHIHNFTYSSAPLTDVIKKTTPWRYDSCLVVTCGLYRFTRVFPCNKKTTGEQTVRLLVEQWFEPYGAPKQVHSNEDVRIRSDTGWYKRVLNALNVEVTTGVPYTHTSNPLCERQNRVVEQNLRILMKQERTKDWVRLVPWAVLTMNSQRSSSTGFTPHELFHGGRPAWFFINPLS